MRFGKLTMHDSDLIMIDMDPPIPSTFYLDHYSETTRLRVFEIDSGIPACAHTSAITISWHPIKRRAPPKK